MSAVRAVVAMALVLTVLSGLPAAAWTSAELVRVSPWQASVETVGLEADAADELNQMWADLVAAAPAHAGCLLDSPPRVEVKADMRPKAAYAPATSTLYVRPGQLDRLVVVHELGHHLDFTCGAAEAVGVDFREAQGLDSSKPWWQHGDPVTWPAEYFANAVAILLGESSRHGVTDEAVSVVGEWMSPSRSVEASEAPAVGDFGDSSAGGIRPI